jgi:ribonuclease R
MPSSASWQAIYTASRVGHYGLAAEHYLHFTSPIRRYPDLLVHRLLKAHWARQGRKPSESMLEREEGQLEEMAMQCSERERAAMQVEREVVSFYACLLMKERVGEEFAATVAAITDFGFFVELDEEHVEGLVKAETVGPGAKLDKQTHALVYAGGRRVRVGQKLRVRLSSVNVTARKMDFEALQFEGEAMLQRVEQGAPHRRREWEAEAPRGHGRERAGRPGRREREVATQGGPRQEAAQGGPRGRFSREGRREEAAPQRAGSRFQRSSRDAETSRPAAASEPTKGPKRRMFVRPEPPAFPATEAEVLPQSLQGSEAGAGSEAPEAQPLPLTQPWEAPVESAGDDASRSPHPGFDRIRALASQRKGGRADVRGAAHPKHGGNKHQGRDRQQSGPAPRFPAPRPRPETQEPAMEAAETRSEAFASGDALPASAPEIVERPTAEARPSAPAAVVPAAPERALAAAEQVSEAAGSGPTIIEELQAAAASRPKRKAAARKKAAATTKRAAPKKKAPAKAAKKATKKAAKKAVGKAAKKARGAKPPKARAAKTAKPRATAKKSPGRKRR